MKTEKVLRLLSMLHRHDVSERVFREIHGFVGVPTNQKFIFLSNTESIVTEMEGITKDQLPPDVNILYFKIEGQSGFVEAKHRARFKNLDEIRNRDLNSVTIQGLNPVAVRGLEARLRQLLEPQRFVVRTMFYRFPLTWFWCSLVLIWFAEYRLWRYINPKLVLGEPLSAIGAILIFAMALGTALVYANLVTPVFSYWFPYFEIEANLSIHRVRGQLLIGAVWGSVAASGLWNLVNLLRSSGR